MTQEAMILEALQAGRELTPLDSLREFGCLRLAARIYDLRQAGHRIEERKVVSGRKAWSAYRLV